MESITSSKLARYEEILEEINREFEKSTNLKKQIRNVEDSITFYKLNQTHCERKISHLNVKIFSSLSEIENLYDCDTAKYYSILNSRNSYNFFLVEVFLARSLLVKLLNSQWKLHISLQFDSFSINKIVNLSDKNSQLEVIPVEKTLQDCVVSALLFTSVENEWNAINLCSVEVDVSYHFESSRDVTPSTLDDFFNITKLYNCDKSLNCLKTCSKIQYQIKCNFENNILETFIKNSYHRLNLEAFSELANDNKRVVDIQFLVNNEKVGLLYHKDTKIVKLKCTPDLMSLFKKFLQPYIICECKEFRKRFQAVLEKKSELEFLNLDDLILFYQQLRKLLL